MRTALCLALVMAASVGVPAGAAPVVTVARHAAVCGGQTMVVGPHRVSCVHAAVDAGSPPYPGVPVTAPVVCFGDGTSGPRVQLLYAYVAGRPNRAADALRRFRRDWAPRMQGMITGASKCPVRRKPTVPACARQPVEVVDCGYDDFWDPDPPPGSYLATADNLATSAYFGPQPQDRLAALPF